MEEYGLKGNEDLTDSLTHRLELIKDLQYQLESDKISTDDFKFLRMAKKSLKEQEDNKEFICGHNYTDDNCNKVFNNRYALLQHEISCFNITHLEKKEETKKHLECEICGKKFYFNGQQMHPKYLKTRHLKTCNKNIEKNLRKKIKNNLDNLSRDKLQNILKYIDNDIQLTPPSPAPRRHTPSPAPRRHIPSPLSNNISMEINDRESCSSAVSSASSCEWTSWKYDGQWYSYDSSNNVYDESCNHIGERVQDEFNDEWKIEYDD